MNPYLNRLMIQHPGQFYGRRRDVARVLSRVGAERPQSVSVVGERRIGKSSFLFHLTWPEVRSQYLPEKEERRLLVTFFDFQQLRDLSPDHFFELLLERLHATGGPLGIGPSLSGYGGFQKVLDLLCSQDRRLVMFFDEFDAVTASPWFTREFYSFLRSMANNYPVSYVTSSRTELQGLCHSAEIADSPFFNIFTNLYLRPFEKGEALEIITRPSAEAGVPLAPHADFIIDMAGYLPFYLQIACCACFDLLTEGGQSELDETAVEGRFMEEAAPHFDYLVHHLFADQIGVLNALVAGNQPTIEEVHVCRRLARDGYLIEEETGQFRIASRLFAGHLQRSLRSRASVTTAGLGLTPVVPGGTLEQYEIIRRVGEGGMGVVFQAIDLSLKRKVALKVIRPELLHTPSVRKRFLQEARLAAALNHPAITAIYELTEKEHQVVLVMEWLDGKNLKLRILEDGRVEWRRALQWAIEAVSGLAAAHHQGIIHRDIKAVNLFITTSDRLKILDFGLAKNVVAPTPAIQGAELSAAGSLIGTIDYMSPEQACGEVLDARSDLFSMGVVLFEALTGALPFRRDNIPATLHAIVNEPLPDLDLYDVEGGERVQPILNRLLEKNPARRYQSAGAVEKDLREALKRRRFWWFG